MIAMTENNFIKSLLNKGFKYNEEGENNLGEGFLRIWITEDGQERTYELYRKEKNEGPWIVSMIDERGSIYYEHIVNDSENRATQNNTTYEYLEKTKCKYCGGNCPNEDESSAWICEGYRNDPDGLYA